MKATLILACAPCVVIFFTITDISVDESVAYWMDMIPTIISYLF